MSVLFSPYSAAIPGALILRSRTYFGFTRNRHFQCSKLRKRDLECGVSKDEGGRARDSSFATQAALAPQDEVPGEGGLR
jgi:hypothetical protein